MTLDNNLTSGTSELLSEGDPVIEERVDATDDDAGRRETRKVADKWAEKRVAPLPSVRRVRGAAKFHEGRFQGLDRPVRESG